MVCDQKTRCAHPHRALYIPPYSCAHVVDHLWSATKRPDATKMVKFLKDWRKVYHKREYFYIIEYMEFPVVSSQTVLIEAIRIISRAVDPSFVPHPLERNDEVLEYLQNYLPEFLLFDLSYSQANFKEILEHRDSERKFYHGCVVLVHTREQSDLAQEYIKKYSSILCAIPVWRFAALFRSVLEIFKNNPSFTLSWNLQRHTSHLITNKFEITNEPDNVFAYSNIITRLLEHFRLIDHKTSDTYNLVISELLMNAIEHGNCQISHQEKHDWLKNHSDTHELIRTRASDSQVRDKKVRISYEIHHNFNRVIIEDEGAGFNWQSVLKQQPHTTPKEHGFGIAMVRTHVKEISYNEIGNRVMVELEHTAHLEPHELPGVFRTGKEITLQAGQLLVNEKEQWQPELYFIVSGTLILSRRGRGFATFTANDILCGEIDFLLGRRSSSIRAKSDARVIAIGYKKFMESARREPYYMLLLARLMAERLSANATRLTVAIGQIQLFRSLQAKFSQVLARPTPKAQ